MLYHFLKNIKDGNLVDSKEIAFWTSSTKGHGFDVLAGDIGREQSARAAQVAERLKRPLIVFLTKGYNVRNT
jgi:hypothetical protein